MQKIEWVEAGDLTVTAADFPGVWCDVSECRRSRGLVWFGGLGWALVSVDSGVWQARRTEPRHTTQRMHRSVVRVSRLMRRSSKVETLGVKKETAEEETERRCCMVCSIAILSRSGRWLDVGGLGETTREVV